MFPRCRLGPAGQPVHPHRPQARSCTTSCIVFPSASATAQPAYILSGTGSKLTGPQGEAVDAVGGLQAHAACGKQQNRGDVVALLERGRLGSPQGTVASGA